MIPIFYIRVKCLENSPRKWKTWLQCSPQLEGVEKPHLSPSMRKPSCPGSPPFLLKLCHCGAKDWRPDSTLPDGCICVYTVQFSSTLFKFLKVLSNTVSSVTVVGGGVGGGETAGASAFGTTTAECKMTAATVAAGCATSISTAAAGTDPCAAAAQGVMLPCYASAHCHLTLSPT